eukprot:3996700-Alexandrium_andersonii.AAC.1
MDGVVDHGKEAGAENAVCAWLGLENLLAKRWARAGGTAWHGRRQHGKISRQGPKGLRRKELQMSR